MCASPSRARHRGPTNIAQETGNMGLSWSMAVSSHPCFSRLICWFHEIHSPLFSHFSPSLFIAGFIYMSRALLVLACQSVVAEPAAGEGSSGKARSSPVPGHGHLLPSTWGAGGQPSMPRQELPGDEPEPNRPHSPQTHTNVLSPSLQLPWNAAHPGAGTFLPHR